MPGSLLSFPFQPFPCFPTPPPVTLCASRIRTCICLRQRNPKTPTCTPPPQRKSAGQPPPHLRHLARPWHWQSYHICAPPPPLPPPPPPPPPRTRCGTAGAASAAQQDSHLAMGPITGPNTEANTFGYATRLDPSRDLLYSRSQGMQLPFDVAITSERGGGAVGRGEAARRQKSPGS